jgi:hypothetical protein
MRKRHWLSEMPFGSRILLSQLSILGSQEVTLKEESERTEKGREREVAALFSIPLKGSCSQPPAISSSYIQSITERSCDPDR